MLVVSPVIRLYAVVFKVLELCDAELAALRNDFCTGIILDAHRSLVLGKGKEFVDKDVLQIIDLGCIFFVYLGKYYLVLLL